MNLVDLKKRMVTLIVELRNENRWNDDLWNEILEELDQSVNGWNISGNVPKSILPYIVDLVSMLAGGSRFIDESTAAKLEDAEFQLSQLFYHLYENEDNDISN